MRVLVTGQAGFVGGWLQKLLPECVPLVDSAGAQVDIVDEASVAHAISEIDFDAAVHLAAQSFVPDAFEDPVTTYRTNSIGSLNLLTALARKKFKGRLLFVSTADIYGQVEEKELPITETRLPLPLNPYAVSKVAAEEWCRYFQRVEGLDIIIARPFNHIGPGQSPRFAIADFARVIIDIKHGKHPPVLPVGDLDVTRDFTDVRDVVEAYRLLLISGRSGQHYNVCSGREQNMAVAVRDLFELAGVNGRIEIDPSRLRKVGQRRVCGDANLLHQHTGWTPRITWKQSLSDILDDWEKKLL